MLNITGSRILYIIAGMAVALFAWAALGSSSMTGEPSTPAHCIDDLGEMQVGTTSLEISGALTSDCRARYRSSALPGLPGEAYARFYRVQMPRRANMSVALDDMRARITVLTPEFQYSGVGSANDITAMPMPAGAYVLQISTQEPGQHSIAFVAGVTVHIDEIPPTPTPTPTPGSGGESETSPTPTPTPTPTATPTPTRTPASPPPGGGKSGVVHRLSVDAGERGDKTGFDSGRFGNLEWRDSSQAMPIDSFLFDDSENELRLLMDDFCLPPSDIVSLSVAGRRLGSPDEYRSTDDDCLYDDEDPQRFIWDTRRNPFRAGETHEVILEIHKSWQRSCKSWETEMIPERESGKWGFDYRDYGWIADRTFVGCDETTYELGSLHYDRGDDQIELRLKECLAESSLRYIEIGSKRFYPDEARYSDSDCQEKPGRNQRFDFSTSRNPLPEGRRIELYFRMDDDGDDDEPPPPRLGEIRVGVHNFDDDEVMVETSIGGSAWGSARLIAALTSQSALTGDIPAGDHRVAIRWTDPDTGGEYHEKAKTVNVEAGATAYVSFNIDRHRRISRPPSARRTGATPSDHAVKAGESVEFEAEATDPDSDLVSARWKYWGKPDAPEEFAPTGSRASKKEITFPVAGVFPVEARFKDASGKTDRVVWQVHVYVEAAASQDDLAAQMNQLKNVKNWFLDCVSDGGDEEACTDLIAGIESEIGAVAQRFETEYGQLRDELGDGELSDEDLRAIERFAGETGLVDVFEGYRMFMYGGLCGEICFALRMPGTNDPLYHIGWAALGTIIVVDVIADARDTVSIGFGCLFSFLPWFNHDCDYAGLGLSAFAIIPGWGKPADAAQIARQYARLAERSHSDALVYLKASRPNAVAGLRWRDDPAKTKDLMNVLYPAPSGRPGLAEKHWDTPGFDETMDKLASGKENAFKDADRVFDGLSRKYADKTVVEFGRKVMDPLTGKRVEIDVVIDDSGRETWVEFHRAHLALIQPENKNQKLKLIDAAVNSDPAPVEVVFELDGKGVDQWLTRDIRRALAELEEYGKHNPRGSIDVRVYINE